MIPHGPESEDDASGASAGGLLVMLAETPRGAWRWWRVDADAADASALGRERGFTPGEDLPWEPLGEEARVVALVPAARAPVRIAGRPAMPLAQALAAARLDPPGRIAAAGEELHVAVAASADGARILSCAVAAQDIDLWLAELAAESLGDAGLVPAALVLPDSEGAGIVTAMLAGQPLARSRDAAFAGEPELVAALAGAPDAPEASGAPEPVAGDALRALLFAAWCDPPLDLRQGAYARRRTTFLRLPDWRQLARMAALLALLAFAVLVVETVKLNRDASAREAQALAAARARFPAAADLASAQAQVDAALVRAGAGGGFGQSAPAVFAAMQPLPTIRLRNVSYAADGTLTIRAAAPAADPINRMLIALQRDGWRVTVPPDLAPDSSGAIVADITVRAP